MEPGSANIKMLDKLKLIVNTDKMNTRRGNDLFLNLAVSYFSFPEFPQSISLISSI